MRPISKAVDKDSGKDKKGKKEETKVSDFLTNWIASKKTSVGLGYLIRNISSEAEQKKDRQAERQQADGQAKQLHHDGDKERAELSDKFSPIQSKIRNFKQKPDKISPEKQKTLHSYFLPKPISKKESISTQKAQQKEEDRPKNSQEYIPSQQPFQNNVNPLQYAFELENSKLESCQNKNVVSNRGLLKSQSARSETEDNFKKGNSSKEEKPAHGGQRGRRRKMVEGQTSLQKFLKKKKQMYMNEEKSSEQQIALDWEDIYRKLAKSDTPVPLPKNQLPASTLNRRPHRRKIQIARKTVQKPSQMQENSEDSQMEDQQSKKYLSYFVAAPTRNGGEQIESVALRHIIENKTILISLKDMREHAPKVLKLIFQSYI